MHVSLVAAALAGALALAGWAGARLVRDRPVVLRQLQAAAVVEALVVVQVVWAVVGLVSGGGRPLNATPTFVGYLVTALVLLPAAGLWAFAERSRWSSAVLVLAALALAVVELRLYELWNDLAVAL